MKENRLSLEEDSKVMYIDMMVFSLGGDAKCANKLIIRPGGMAFLKLPPSNTRNTTYFFEITTPLDCKGFNMNFGSNNQVLYTFAPRFPEPNTCTLQIDNFAIDKKELSNMLQRVSALSCGEKFAIAITITDHGIQVDLDYKHFVFIPRKLQEWTSNDSFLQIQDNVIINIFRIGNSQPREIKR